MDCLEILPVHQTHYLFTPRPCLSAVRAPVRGLLTSYTHTHAHHHTKPPRKPPRTRAFSYVKLNACHDFAWSRSLWKEAATSTGRLAFGLVVVYMVLAYFLLARLDDVNGIEAW